MELLLDGFKNDVDDKCKATRSGFTTAKGLGTIPEPVTDDVPEVGFPMASLPGKFAYLFMSTLCKDRQAQNLP